MQAVHPATVIGRPQVEAASGIQRIGGAMGVLFGLIDLAVAVVLIASLSRARLTPPLTGKEAQFVDYLQTMLPVLLPLTFAETVAAILALLFVRALDQRLRAHSPAASSFAALCGYAGLVILMIDFASFITLEQAITGGSSHQAVEGLIPGWTLLTGTAGTVGGLLVITWQLTVNWIAARKGGYPRVLGYFGLLAGVVATVGLVLSAHGFTHLLTNLWEIGLGVVLFVRPSPAKLSAIP